MGSNFEGLQAAEIHFSEPVKKQEQKSWKDLDPERSDRLGWILNNKGLPSFDQLENRWEDALEFPEDYPQFNKEVAERLLGGLKNLDPSSEEFKASVEQVADMLQ